MGEQPFSAWDFVATSLVVVGIFFTALVVIAALLLSVNFLLWVLP
jgi:hypothetical protein